MCLSVILRSLYNVLCGSPLPEPPQEEQQDPWYPPPEDDDYPPQDVLQIHGVGC